MVTRRRATRARVALTLLFVLACSAHTAATGHCDNLIEQYKEVAWPVGGGGGGGGGLAVRIKGREVDVSLVWGSAPARAGAALLRALLAAALRYRRVSVAPHAWNHSLVELARHVEYRPIADYSELVLVVSAAWAGEAGAACVTADEDECGAAGPRLREFGAASIPARARLHARLVPAAAASAALNRSRCTDAGRWPFYTDITSLRDCYFRNDSDGRNGSVLVYYPAEDKSALNETLRELQRRVAAASLLLSLQPLRRAELFLKLNLNVASFFFLDYDIWTDDPRVTPVKSPPSDVANRREELDPSEAVRAVDSNRLTKYAPSMYDAFHKFYPTQQSLRDILENEAKGVEVEEAACIWALENPDPFADLINKAISKNRVGYNELVLLCKDDSDIDEYVDLMNSINKIILTNMSLRNYDFGIDYYNISCDDPNAAITQVGIYMSGMRHKYAIGLVSSDEGQAAALAAYAANEKWPLLVYNTPADGIDAAETRLAPVWSSTGRLRPLARVTLRLAAAQGWTRLAVLSDTTPLATDFFAALNDPTDRLVLRNFPVPLDLSPNDAIALLKKLRDVNARIIFVNARADIAAAILSVAAASHMMNDDYAWLVRDWPPGNNTGDVCVVSISYWCLSDDGVSSGEGAPELRKEMNRLWAARAWPTRAVALTDAILTLAYSFRKVLELHPYDVDLDLRTDRTLREFKNVMMGGFVEPGVLGELRYEANTRARARPDVFVERWSGANRTRLVRCRVDDDQVGCDLKTAYPGGAPADGASRCAVSSGDAFAPSCHDGAWISALVVAALVPPAGWLVRRAVLQRLARRDRRLLLVLLARRERAAEALAAHLVPRAALELREELGAGRFGRVRIALLRSSGGARVVAAKSLREGAAPSEESEFLREACTLAALEHEHVVRLVGVCADDGPPLVLMEHAFFGDLLRYLRARRHLAEVAPDGSEETAHVSPEALTRLAREAASALGYLALRGLVHRDVRAANCLVDARRSLKLADFGMARETAAGTDGAAEYACRRRALFPVLWMAPESLARGVFSAASDVWALGVLLLELVTLGERPYGDMSPLRVLQFVAAGGRPPLPLDTTPQTRGVALACWQRAAEQRPTAPELVSYLAAHPRALHAALHSPRLEHTDADSGFGEPASPDLLPPDNCLGLEGLDYAIPR